MKKLITLSAVAMMIAAAVNAQSYVHHEEKMVKNDLKKWTEKKR